MEGEEGDPALRLLVSWGAELNRRDRHGLTALHYACMRGNRYCDFNIFGGTVLASYTQGVVIFSVEIKIILMGSYILS